MDSNRFVPYVDVYFKIYLFGGLFFQFILLFLIVTKSPTSLSGLKFFLFNTCFLQIFLISVTFFSQHRNLPNSKSLAVLPNGFCRFFGPNVCFSAYHFFLGIALCVGLGISNTVLFRLQTLKSGRSAHKKALRMISITYIPSVITVIIPFTSVWNFEEVRMETYSEHPSYNLTIYEPFVGFQNIETWQFVVATSLLTFGAYGIPLMSGVLTVRVIQLINVNKNMSFKTKKQSRTLAYGLGVQTLLPLVCYIPLPTFYMISQIFNHEMLVTEHLLTIVISFPSIIDPLISFYFIIPYRTALFNLLRLQKPTHPNTISQN